MHWDIPILKFGDVMPQIDSGHYSGFAHMAYCFEVTHNQQSQNMLCIWTVHHCDSWRIKDQLDVTCFFFLFYFLCTQHVSDVNIAIIRSLRLRCWITTLVVLFLVRCVLESWCGWVWVVSVLQAEAQQQHGYYSKPTAPNLQHTAKQEQNDQCGNSTA